MIFDQISILGIGLIGGSILKALRGKCICNKIIAWDWDKKVRERCSRMSLCDEVKENLQDAVVGSSFIVICTPVDTIKSLLQQISQIADHGAIVTDTGSTKSSICEFASNLFLNEETIFIGSHPMAGSEKAGLEYADKDIFKNKPCFVVTEGNKFPEKVSKVMEFWKALEMRPIRIDPSSHDEVVASVSHVPQFLSTVLGAYMMTKDSRMSEFSGNGLRDMTRLAGSSEKMWLPIFQTNKKELIKAISQFEEKLQKFKNSIEKNSVDQELIFQQGREFHIKLNQK